MKYSRCDWAFIFQRKWGRKENVWVEKPGFKFNISWNEYCTYRVILARARSKILSEIPLGAQMDAHLAGKVNIIVNKITS